MQRSDEILWNILELHLDEADFLFEQWLAGRRSHRYTLRDLRDTFEGRLLANVEGMVVNGPEPLQHWIVPIITGHRPAKGSELAAAVMTGIAAGDVRVFDRLAAVADAAGSAGLDDEDLDALVWAMCMVEHPGLEGQLRAALRSAEGFSRAALLEVFAGRGLDPGSALDAAFHQNEPVTLLAALRAARAAERSRYLAAVESAAWYGSPKVREAALDLGLLWGSRIAWQVASNWGLSAEGCSRVAMECLARGGDARVVDALCERLDEPYGRADLAWALGYSGRVSAVEACLAKLDAQDEMVRRCAADSVAMIVGLSRHDVHLWEQAPVAQNEDEQDDEEDGEPHELDQSELPLPRADAIRAWWDARRRDFSRAERYVLGVPFDPGTRWQQIGSLPCRRVDRFADETPVGLAGGRPWPWRAQAQVLLRRISSGSASPWPARHRRRVPRP